MSNIRYDSADKMCGVAIAIVVFIVAIIVLSGCGGSKKITTTKQSDSTYIKSLETKVKSSDSLVTVTLKRLKSMETGIEFAEQVPCDDSLLIEVIETLDNDVYIERTKKDSLIKILEKLRKTAGVPGAVYVYPNGSIEAKGYIRAISLKLVDQVDSMSNMRLHIIDLQQQLKESLRVKTETTVKKSSKWQVAKGLWYAWIILGIVIGVAGKYLLTYNSKLPL